MCLVVCVFNFEDLVVALVYQEEVDLSSLAYLEALAFLEEVVLSLAFQVAFQEVDLSSLAYLEALAFLEVDLSSLAFQEVVLSLAFQVAYQEVVLSLALEVDIALEELEQKDLFLEVALQKELDHQHL